MKMPQRPDLTITFGLEAQDVEANAEKLRDAIREIFDASKGKEVSPELQQLQAQLVKVFNASENVSKALNDMTDSVPTEKYSNMIHANEELQNSLKESRRTIKELETALAEASKPSFAYTEQYNKLSSALNKAQSDYEDAKASIIGYEERLEYLNSRLQREEAELQAFRTQFEATRASMSDKEIKDATNELGFLQFRVNSTKNSIENTTTALNDAKKPLGNLSNTIRATSEEMKELEDAGKAMEQKDNSAKIKEITKAIEKEKQKLEETTEKYREQNRAMSELSDAEKFRADPEWDKKHRQLEQYNNDMSKLVRKYYEVDEASNKSPLESINGWQLLVDTINQGPQAIVRFADTMVSSFAAIHPAIQVAYAAIKKLISLTFEFAKELTDAFKKVATKAINVANVALKALLKTLTKIASATILRPIQKIGDAIASIGKKAQSSTPSLKQLGRMFLQYGIGARSLYRLINKLRTALFEGFGTLAVAYEPFNASMSQIMTSLEYLKNSFAAAFAPIIQYVAPALSLFIDKMAGAVQMIGQFIAALTGKEFVMAMPVYQDYAENSKAGAAAAKETAAAEKAAAKAEKARAKALKEVQRTIAGFDDVEILKEPTDSSSDSGNDVSIPDTPTLNKIASTFKTAPIQSALQNFADLIKKAWLEADFYDIGQLLSQQLGKALKAFNENVPEIEKFVRRVASSIATFLAGFLSINDTFVQLGKAIGNSINLIFAFLQEFLVKFIENDGFKNLGKDIYYTIYNSLHTIKWDTIFNVFATLGEGIAQTLNESITKPGLWQEIFKTLCNSMQAMLLGFYVFVTKMKWAQVGSAIGAGINTAIENYPLKLLANSAAKFINGIFTAIGNAARKIQWAKLGKNIADSIMLFFRQTEWRKNGEDLGSFIQGIFNTLKTFVDNTHFDEIAADIVDFIKGFFSKFRWRQNLTTLANFLNGLLDGLRTVVGPINWGDVGKKAVDAIIWFFDHFHWEEAIDTFFDLIEGLVELLFTIVDDGRVQKVGGEIIAKIKEKLESPEWKETTTKLWNLFLYWLDFKVAQIVAKDGPLWIIAGSVLKGLAKGIIENMPFSAEWFRVHLIDPFLTNVKSSFGIKDDESGASKTMPIGVSIIMGIVNGILENIPFTPAWFDKHLFSKVKSGLDESFGIEDGQSMNLFTVGKAIIKGITGGVDKEEPNLNTKTASVNKQTQKNLSAGNWSGIGGPTIIGGITSGLNNFSGGLYTLTNGINSNVFTKLSAGDWFSIGSKTMIGNTQSGMNNQSRNIQNTAAIINTGLFRNLSAGNWFNIGSKTMVAGVQSGMNNQNRYILNTAQAINSGVFRNLQAGNWTNMGYSLINATRAGMYKAQNLAINQAKNIQSSIYSNLSNGNYDRIGSNITSDLYYGFRNNSYRIENEADNLAYRIGRNLDSVDGYSIGDNIAYGIYRGLDSNWNWLANTVENLAVDLYNSACWALGIHSPSKVFADKVGAMIPAGIAVGINANSDIATKSIDNMTDSIVDSAMGIKIPPIAMGEIIPYNTDAPEESANTLKGVLSVLQSLEDSTVKRDELEEILTNVIRSNMNIDFYIGDEKLARHTNRGNSLIDRRYNAVSTT